MSVRLGDRNVEAPYDRCSTLTNDLFRARLDQIINLKHELVLLAGKIDWDWIDAEIAPLYSENGQPRVCTENLDTDVVVMESAQDGA